MSAPLLQIGANQFAQGMTKFSDNLPGQNADRNFIVIPVTLGGHFTLAAIDTGSEFCVIGPDEARQIVDISYWREGERGFGGHVYTGRYGTISVSIESHSGEGVTVDNATVWVPQLVVGQEWRYPNVLGWSSFLQKIRFAVDPENNRFYFGAFGNAP